jgi:hypothetical protein
MINDVIIHDISQLSRIWRSGCDERPEDYHAAGSADRRSGARSQAARPTYRGGVARGEFEKALDAASASLLWPVIPQIAEHAFKADHSTACFTKEALGHLCAPWRGAVLLAEPEML